MSEWQPIETAPKDGTTFIIGRDDSEHHAYSGVAFWSLGRFRDPTESVTRTIWVDPTHWQPFPAPPALTETDPVAQGN